MDHKLGCVLAVRDRPVEVVERTLQTYDFQTLQPFDKVLLHQGSSPQAAEEYRRLCQRHGWRYVASLRRESVWHCSSAFNDAVAALSPEVEIVFKSGVDVLLGRDVLETADHLARCRLCVFSCLATRQGCRYPRVLAGHRDLLDLLEASSPPEVKQGEGAQAFPRKWFEQVGGYDLAYQGWGYEDSDLRQRAGWSIGFLEVFSCLLIHQWHPPANFPEQLRRNRDYYERSKQSRLIVRNGGPLSSTAGDTPRTAPRGDPKDSLEDWLSLVPPAARQVLDVGCGSGELAKKLKRQRQVVVHGLALDEKQAEGARGVLDSVSLCDVEGLEAALPAGPFDCILCREILARVRDPERLLEEARKRLSPQGTLIAGFANVRHHSVVARLLDGTWDWEPTGVLGRDQVRFFTRREAEKLLYRAGFEVVELRPLPGPGQSEWEARDRPDEVRVGPLAISGLADAEDFYASGYLFSARPKPAPPHDRGLTSIVILTHNQLAYTERCVSSIREHTPEPYELIFIDNASTDGTREYLLSLADAKVILNEENRGFPAGCNQGIKASSGSQVLLLNNDTVVTTGWLDRMLDALSCDEKIALVGPCSNCVSGEQQIAASYDSDLVGLEGFAWEWGKSHDRERVDNDRLVGFCLLIRREAIERVGLLDERFGTGCFEDDDYSRRMLAAGYRAVIARDSFVHHFGSRTFAGSGVDLGRLLNTNREVYRKKWEAEEKAGAKVTSTLLVPAEPKGANQVSSPPDLRVLVVAHVGALGGRMDKSHYHRYLALARRPGVSLFGPGLPGYRPGMSLKEAVRVACRGIMPDVVLHGGDLRESGVPLLSDLADSPGLTAIELLDSWTRPERQSGFIRRQRFDLGLIQEAGPHLAFYQKHCPQTEFFWTPNAVDTNLFRQRRLPKEWDVLLYGETSPEVYPLRARLARLLANQRELRFHHIRHPGYYPGPQEQRRVLAGAELSCAINRSWIGLATCSVYQCLLMKYLEIAASGGLVAGNLPEHARPLFSNDFIELSMEQSDREILDTLKRHLADKERLESMAESARRRVVKDFSTDAFADKVPGLFRQALAQRKGARGTKAHAAERVSLSASQEESQPPEPCFTLTVAPGGGLLLQRSGVQLSLCLIARDNAGTLAAALESIKPWVDEMVVVDTGSKDDTPKIAERLGARVFHFPWCDDFSAARNESLKYARGEWIFWMDSDDTIDPDHGRKLRELISSADSSVMGYVIQVHCPGAGPEGGTDLTVVDHVKLFRNLPALRFEGRIHEQILPAIRALGGQVAWTDLFVTHSGYDHSPEGQERKKQRDLHLLHLEHKERGEHTFTLFNLGMTYADIGQHEEAVDYLRRSIAAAIPEESHLRKAYALLVHSLGKLNQPESAWEVCSRGLELFAGDLELSFRRAILMHERGDLQGSAHAYLELLGNHRERHFTSVDRGISSFKARHNLAVVYSDMGDLVRAEEQWRMVTQEQPDYRQGWRGLGETLLRQGKQQELSALIEHLHGEPRLCGEASLLLGQIAQAQGDLEEARKHFEQSVKELPTDPAPLQALCRLLFEHGEMHQAEEALGRLIKLCPEDAAAHHNLGTIHLQQGKHQQAAEEYQKSLRLRPNAPETQALLGHALQTLEIQPDNQKAAQILQQS
jgi:GT2 family glycosyltransferase/tetratricopeptide (TPR) repeat protein/2-polyprenyl-3-methyl-5-hydroxy-6-metoxy-1,4-benzoquinol methylase